MCVDRERFRMPPSMSKMTIRVPDDGRGGDLRLRRCNLGAFEQGPDLQNILRFIVRLS